MQTATRSVYRLGTSTQQAEPPTGAVIFAIPTNFKSSTVLPSRSGGTRNVVFMLQDPVRHTPRTCQTRRYTDAKSYFWSAFFVRSPFNETRPHICNRECAPLLSPAIPHAVQYSLKKLPSFQTAYDWCSVDVVDDSFVARILSIEDYIEPEAIGPCQVRRRL